MESIAQLSSEVNQLRLVKDVLDSPIYKIHDELKKSGRQPRWKQFGESLEARSPLREDHKPSLYVCVGDDGRILMKDHGSTESPKKTAETICDALKLPRMILSPIKAQKRIKNAPPFELLDHNTTPWSLDGQGAKAIKFYRYWDEDSQLLFEVVRCVMPDGSKTFRQRRPINGMWAWTLKAGTDPRDNVAYPEVRRVLYCLRELLKADPSLPVFIVEGEKDVDRLRSQGKIATCNPGGAGAEKWGAVLDLAREVLAGRHLVVIGDNDDKGKKHARTIANSTVHAAASVKLIESLPGVTEKGDVSDWLDAGHTIAELDELVANTPLVEKPPQDDIEANLTDKGNAERFAHQYGDKVRYCFPLHRWFIFDGRRWREDQQGEVVRLALLMSQLFFKRAQEAEDIGDKKTARSLLEYGLRLERKGTVEAMLELAKSFLPVSPEGFDADPMLLNVENGTLDLRTAELRPHDPEDFITKLAPVEFLGVDEPVELWAQCLTTWSGGDKQWEQFIQQWAGYCLTGDNTESLFPIFYGPGANGKSVFLDTTAEIMGDYAGVAALGMMAESARERHMTEIMSLRGRRRVVASETKPNAPLRMDLVKAATGDKRLTGRFMRADEITFERTHKFILVTNNKPRIFEDDEGVWRRVRLVPFRVVIPKKDRDPKLIEKLRAEAPGILAWMVRGCLDWRKSGIMESTAVEQATQEYRREESPVGQFIDACCELAKPHRVRATDLWQSFEAWCKSAGHYVLDQRKFSSAMRQAAPDVQKKTAKIDGKPCEAWHGIHLRPDAPRFERF